MSLTYTQQYKVVVPPLDLFSFSAPRRAGVRLREHCAPMNDMRDFEVLYLPKQLAEEHKERLALEQAHAQRTLDVLEAGTDVGLNGTKAQKALHALRHQFAPLKGADGRTTFAVKFRQERRATQAHSLPLAASAATATAADDECEPDQPGGLAWWMRVEPHGVSLPRSTTQATYRALPEESFLLDQRCFHSAFEPLPPPTPCLTSRGTVRPASPRDSLRLKRLPLCSSEQPSLFFRVPDRAAHPHLWRASRTLRAETNARRALESSARNRVQMEQERARETDIRSELERPSRSAVTGVFDLDLRSTVSEPAPATARPRPHPPLHVGSLTARVVPFVPHRPSTSSSSSGGVAGASTATSGPSQFQLHMQKARQRWKEQGLASTDSESR